MEIEKSELVKLAEAHLLDAPFGSEWLIESLVARVESLETAISSVIERCKNDGHPYLMDVAEDLRAALPHP